MGSGVASLEKPPGFWKIRMEFSIDLSVFINQLSTKIVVIELDLLVPLGFIRYRTSTCGLSTSSSPRGLITKAYLEVGFVLRFLSGSACRHAVRTISSPMDIGVRRIVSEGSKIDDVYNVDTCQTCSLYKQDLDESTLSYLSLPCWLSALNTFSRIFYK